MIERLLERLCERIAERFPKKIIPRPDGEPYLVRYYLLGRENRSFNVFLHQFITGDPEYELHSHPWESSWSFILTGGYLEERRFGEHVVVRALRPFSFNVLKAVDFHRVILIKDRAWTVFVASKPMGTWHFWDRKTHKKTWWRDHIANRAQRHVPEA